MEGGEGDAFFRKWLENIEEMLQIYLWWILIEKFVLAIEAWKFITKYLYVIVKILYGFNQINGNKQYIYITTMSRKCGYARNTYLYKVKLFTCNGHDSCTFKPTFLFPFFPIVTKSILCYLQIISKKIDSRYNITN